MLEAAARLLRQVVIFFIVQFRIRLNTAAAYYYRSRSWNRERERARALDYQL